MLLLFVTFSILLLVLFSLFLSCNIPYDAIYNSVIYCYCRTFHFHLLRKREERRTTTTTIAINDEQRAIAVTVTAAQSPAILLLIHNNGTYVLLVLRIITLLVFSFSRGKCNAKGRVKKRTKEFLDLVFFLYFTYGPFSLWLCWMMMV